jgi:hypothetical protein
MFINCFLIRPGSGTSSACAPARRRVPAQFALGRGAFPAQLWMNCFAWRNKCLDSVRARVFCQRLRRLCAAEGDELLGGMITSITGIGHPRRRTGGAVLFVLPPQALLCSIDAFGVVRAFVNRGFIADCLEFREFLGKLTVRNRGVCPDERIVVALLWHQPLCCEYVGAYDEQPGCEERDGGHCFAERKSALR